MLKDYFISLVTVQQNQMKKRTGINKNNSPKETPVFSVGTP